MRKRAVRRAARPLTCLVVCNREVRQLLDTSDIHDICSIQDSDGTRENEIEGEAGQGTARRAARWTGVDAAAAAAADVGRGARGGGPQEERPGRSAAPAAGAG